MTGSRRRGECAEQASTSLSCGGGDYVCFGWEAAIWCGIIRVMRASSLCQCFGGPSIALFACVAVSAHAGSFYSEGRCGGSPAHWSPQGSEFGELLLHDKLYVTPKKLTWNDTPVTRAVMHSRLLRARQMPPNVSLQVIFSGRTGCHFVQSIRTDISAALQCGRDHKCIEYSDTDRRRDAVRLRSR